MRPDTGPILTWPRGEWFGVINFVHQPCIFEEYVNVKIPDVETGEIHALNYLFPWNIVVVYLFSFSVFLRLKNSKKISPITKNVLSSPFLWDTKRAVYEVIPVLKKNLCDKLRNIFKSLLFIDFQRFTKDFFIHNTYVRHVCIFQYASDTQNIPGLKTPRSQWIRRR